MRIEPAVARRSVPRPLRQPLHADRRAGGAVADLGRPGRRGRRPARSGRPGARAGPVEQLPDRASWSTCSAAAIARSTGSPTSPGTSSAASPGGWARVQAVCDWVHDNVQFGYQFARPTKTAYDVYEERTGVCRDFTHLALTFCRCLNIPARYATGYLGDIGVPSQPVPDGLQRLVRGLPRAAAGTRSTPATTSRGSAAS